MSRLHKIAHQHVSLRRLVQQACAVQPTIALEALLARAGGDTLGLSSQIMRRLHENAERVFPSPEGAGPMAHLQFSLAADCREQVRPAVSTRSEIADSGTSPLCTLLPGQGQSKQ